MMAISAVITVFILQRLWLSVLLYCPTSFPVRISYLQNIASTSEKNDRKTKRFTVSYMSE